MLPLEPLARPDLRLLVMGLLMVVSACATLLLSVPFSVAGSVGSALAAVAMLDGILLRPPTES
ncbi:hypothetical protein [Candidatus Halobonum tyrrellensis]|uniref:Uncharacterized protein n=1 Tax=Candidatus Halobonum tyrrellensis G22 TaxID=1324957 RepID=V4HJV6_9EURY|nr:hypothetical protein [Candidatus Halobonum tyrrellensis]ESP88199.1 hypothetical protein K933_10325 [Candidatus Halobonum tyrrellensis G22]